MIEAGYVKEGILADWMMAGLEFRFTTAIVSQYMIDFGNEPVRISIIYTLFDRMQPMST